MGECGVYVVHSDSTRRPLQGSRPDDNGGSET